MACVSFPLPVEVTYTEEGNENPPMETRRITESEDVDTQEAVATTRTKRKVTISTIEQGPSSSSSSSHQNRGRVFSIDLDPSFLDSMIANGDGTDLPSILLCETGSTMEGGGRNRALSFECFAFGINADEPLPPLQDQQVDETGGDNCSVNSANRPRGDSIYSFSSARPRGDSIVSFARPRGDSIIFDPTSFHEGGIHEKNASALVSATSSSCSSNNSHPRNRLTSIDLLDDGIQDFNAPPFNEEHELGTNDEAAFIPSDVLSASGAVFHPGQACAQEAVAMEHAVAETPGPLTSSPVVSGTLSSSSSATAEAESKQEDTTTFSLELLNKDGRVGIYLPDARKARIARFHEKRKMRIWRKRIKYDCRKKLADRRPRVKGRFVKRCDPVPGALAVPVGN